MDKVLRLSSQLLRHFCTPQLETSFFASPSSSCLPFSCCRPKLASNFLSTRRQRKGRDCVLSCSALVLARKAVWPPEERSLLGEFPEPRAPHQESWSESEGTHASLEPGGLGAVGWEGPMGDTGLFLHLPLTHETHPDSWPH